MTADAQSRDLSLWRRAWFESGRVEACPHLKTVVVAVDPPPVTGIRETSGIIVAGRGDDDRVYVLADRAREGLEPNVWARAAVEAYYEFKAGYVAAESSSGDQGGNFVRSVLNWFDHSIPVRTVRVTRGRWLRAEPVAALYAEGRVLHVGHFPQLEAQMADFGTSMGEFDRIDPLILAITALFDTARTPTIRYL